MDTLDQPTVRILGPPLDYREDAQKFQAAHLNDEILIENGQFVVNKASRFPTIEEAIGKVMPNLKSILLLSGITRKK